jgi:hypothetical protein
VSHGLRPVAWWFGAVTMRPARTRTGTGAPVLIVALTGEPAAAR